MKTIQSQFDYITDISLGYWKSQALITAVELGIFTSLREGWKSAASISKLIKTDKRATGMLLDAMVSMKFLEKKGGVFKNSSISGCFLVEGLPFYQGNRIRLAKNLWNNWSNLSCAVQTGKPVAFDSAGKKADTERLNVFISAMRDFAVIKSKQIAKIIDLSGRKRFLDLGGGPGSYAIEFVRVNPELHAEVFDLNDVTKITKRFIKEACLEKRVKIKSGECINDDYGKNEYDVIFVSNLIHMYDSKINKKIIKKCKTALTKNGMIMIHDFMLDSPMTDSPVASLFSLNMLVGTHGGRNYYKSEINEWLKCAGFRKLEVVKLGSDTNIIRGFK